jgi:hypothetical protein
VVWAIFQPCDKMSQVHALAREQCSLVGDCDNVSQACSFSSH